MTLLMRDQENMEKGMELERERIVSNALMSTGSVKQTVLILGLEERTVRKIAEAKGIPVND